MAYLVGDGTSEAVGEIRATMQGDVRSKRVPRGRACARRPICTCVAAYAPDEVRNGRDNDIHSRGPEYCLIRTASSQRRHRIGDELEGIRYPRRVDRSAHDDSCDTANDHNPVRPRCEYEESQGIGTCGKILPPLSTHSFLL